MVSANVRLRSSAAFCFFVSLTCLVAYDRAWDSRSQAWGRVIAWEEEGG
jgi:hypothetical protein